MDYRYYQEFDRICKNSDKVLKEVERFDEIIRSPYFAEQRLWKKKRKQGFNIWRNTAKFFLKIIETVLMWTMTQIEIQWFSTSSLFLIGAIFFALTLDDSSLMRFLKKKYNKRAKKKEWRTLFKN